MSKRKKERLHFVYAVPYATKIRNLTFNKVLPYRRFWKYSIWWRNPIPAPFSITYNILNALDKHFDILLYDVYEKTSIELKEGDKFLGHFWPDMTTKEKGNNSWVTYDKEHVTNRIILDYPNDKRVFAISPFNHSKEQMGWAIPLLKQVGRYIGITGDYWVNNLANSEFSFLDGHLAYLNMPIDTGRYPRVKFRFNKKSNRKFLYIGRVSKEKNIDMLEAIAANEENFYGGYIGSGVIKGWHQIAQSAVLTPQLMRKLAKEYDFFINASTYDAQATTVLEAMSWGFVVACTPQTGYVEDSIFALSINNLEHNLKVIELMNSLDENELQSIISQYQILLREKYTWQKFTNKLIKTLNNEFIQTN